jgi:hypothetical protein
VEDAVAGPELFPERPEAVVSLAVDPEGVSVGGPLAEAGRDPAQRRGVVRVDVLGLLGADCGQLLLERRDNVEGVMDAPHAAAHICCATSRPRRRSRISSSSAVRSLNAASISFWGRVAYLVSRVDGHPQSRRWRVGGHQDDGNGRCRWIGTQPSADFRAIYVQHSVVEQESAESC